MVIMGSSVPGRVSRCRPAWRKCMISTRRLVSTIVFIGLSETNTIGYIPRQIRFADASKHAQVRLEQGEQALCPVLMHVTPRVFLLRMIDVLVYVALQGAVAAGGVCVQPASRLD